MYSPTTTVNSINNPYTHIHKTPPIYNNHIHNTPPIYESPHLHLQQPPLTITTSTPITNPNNKPHNKPHNHHYNNPINKPQLNVSSPPP